MKASDLFPDIDEELDRRISFSELRIKNWIILGILGNIVTLVGAALPVIFYLGQMNATATQALDTIRQQQIQLDITREWRAERMLWESSTEQWMISKGYVPPRDRK